MKRIFCLFNAVGRQRRKTNGGRSSFGEISRISFVGLAHKKRFGIFGIFVVEKHSPVIKPRIKQISRIYFYNYEPLARRSQFHKFYELGEPWRLLGNHPDGAFAKKAKNSFNRLNPWLK